MNVDLSKSLQELEGKEWGGRSYDPGVVTNCQRLWAVPLQELLVEDLRVMIGHNTGLTYVVPLALEFLQKHPFTDGDDLKGDLMASLLRIDSGFWAEHVDWRRDVYLITRGVLDKFGSYANDRRGKVSLTMEALNGAYEAFKRENAGALN